MLEDGTPGTFDRFQKAMSAVKIDVVSKSVQPMRGNVELASDSFELPSSWTCSPNGQLEATFEGDADGEHSVGARVRLNLTLERARDGSLIAHTITQFYGGFPPYRERTEHWMRFARLTD